MSPWLGREADGEMEMEMERDVEEVKARPTGFGRAGG